uniref:Ankyrin repeat and LEM domain containing 1 n=1 Tax=Cairina moschata TaxID=8855 RepID=A0A8C3C3Q1_CAIMO
MSLGREPREGRGRGGAPSPELGPGAPPGPWVAEGPRAVTAAASGRRTAARPASASSPRWRRWSPARPGGARAKQDPRSCPPGTPQPWGSCLCCSEAAPPGAPLLAPRGPLAARPVSLQGVAPCSPPSSATSPPAPRAASRPQRSGSEPPLPLPPSLTPPWRCPGGPPGSEHPGVSPGTPPPPWGTASPLGARMCPAGTEKARLPWMTPRSSPRPPASPAPPWGAAAPAPRCCWVLGTATPPRAPRQTLRAPPAPSPRCCWVLGTVTPSRTPHQTLRAPPTPPTPGCWSRGAHRCRSHPPSASPIAPWSTRDGRPASSTAPVQKPPAPGTPRSPRGEHGPRGCSPTRRSAGHSPELAAALQTGHVPDCTQDERVLAQQFDRPDRSRHWREGLLKASFNYLLLDPRVTQDLPLRCHRLSPAECFRTFVKAVFYVGKGTRARPYCHLSEALSQYRGCPKVRRILEIWGSGQGVISVHCFQSSVPAEAYTRESCVVEALGLQTITNQRKGNCYGAAASWPPERRRRLGVHMLHRAMRIFLAEGERQLRPADIQGGR